MYLITPAASGTFGLIFLFIWALLSIFSLISMLRNKSINPGAKLLWVVIIIILPVLGALVYLLLRSLRSP